MTSPNLRQALGAALLLTASVSIACAAQSQAAPLTLEESVPPGANYDKADFRLWMPGGVDAIQAAIILMPGSNGDGRAMAEDAAWQDFAAKHKLALIGCRITDKPHEQSFLEEYADVSRGSGQALLTALTALAARSKHPELAQAPLFLWGMSAGGEFNYEFVAWKPERVAAFVVNKGGIYYTALTSRAARNVPGILFIGGKDLESRVHTITGLFEVNRRAGALWALAEEPGAAHVVGRSIDVARVLFEDVLALRVAGPNSLRPVDDKAGFIGDLKAKTFQPVLGAPAPGVATSWFPTARVARAWQAMVTEKPFEP